MDNLSDKIDKIKMHPQGLAALSIASKIPVEDLLIVLQHGKEIPELKKYIIGTYDDEYGILLKDDAELKTYFQTHTITTINKLLKEENPENEG